MFMFNSTVKTTRQFWRKKYPETASQVYLRNDASFEITNQRIKLRISSIPKRPGFGHWPTMYWACRKLALQDDWWYTQVDLTKKLWREDLIENSNRHRS